MIDKVVNINIGANSAPVVIPITEGDTIWRWRFRLFWQSERWTLPEGAVVKFSGLKPDGNVFDVAGSITGLDEAAFVCNAQMTAVPGAVKALVTVIDSYGRIVATAPVILAVKPNPQTAGPISDSVLSAYDDVLQMLGKAVGVPGAVSVWLDEHISQPVDVVIDSSLTVEGAAADAKAAGDALRILGSTDAVIRWILDGRDVDYIPFEVVNNSYVDRDTGAITAYNGWQRTNRFDVDISRTLYIYNGGDGSMTFCCQYSDAAAETDAYLTKFTVATGWNRIYLRKDCKSIILSWPERYGIASKLVVLNDVAIRANTMAAGTFSVPKAFSAAGWISASLDDAGAEVDSYKRLVSGWIDLGRPNVELHVDSGSWRTLIYEYDENKAHVYHPNAYPGAHYRLITSPTSRYIRILAFDNTDGDKYLYPDDIYGSDIVIEAPEIPAALKVMTYNVGRYGYGVGYGIPDNIYDAKLINWRRLFGREGADIVGVQEFNSWMNATEDESEAIMANSVLWNHFYPYSWNTGSWTAMKSNRFMFWYYTRQLTTKRYYTIAWMNGICLMSVHLTVGVGKEAIRLQETDEILAILANEDRFILFGDFNTEPGEEPALYKKFTDAGYSIANCGFFGNYYTWSSRRLDFLDYENPEGTLYYLDNIVVSPNINIRNVYPVPDAYPMCTSDHIPLVAELDIT